MKKKGFKVLTAAVMLILGAATMSAYAAEGWTMSNNAWTYLDKNGNKVTDEWRKGADNLWRYLNYKGEMALNSWVDDDYYVDSNGIMVSNQWVKTRPQYDDYTEEEWFYFGSSGKAARDGWKKIDGKSYLFDDEGIMQTGWTEDGIYYLGDDGAMKTGWRYIEQPMDEDDDDWEEEPYYGPESADGKYWFYFASNGKKYCPETGTDKDSAYRISRIDGQYYCFDEVGRMMTGWVYLKGDPDEAPGDTIEDWRYFAEAGIANVTLGTTVKGWLSLETPEQLQDNADEIVEWYYFESDGTPKMGPDFGEASTKDFVRINGTYYLFDPKGNPASGLHKVEIGTTGVYTSYYFDENSKTPIEGKKVIEEADGSENTFYFSDGNYAGRGVTGVKDGYLYYMGKLQKAEEDMRYAPISIPDGDTYKTYVVSESGRVAKKKTVKDSDGVKYTTSSAGILTHIDEEEVGAEEYGEPIEPAFEEWD